MRVNYGILGVAAVATLALSACGDSKRVPNLMQVHSQSRSPDEFAILPTKPLTMPDDLKKLPEPTPGGGNITDPTPEADAAVALGGKARALVPGTIGAGDAGLVNYSQRFGSASDIRKVLASEDLAFRRRHDGRLLERIFSINVYFKAYKRMSLDQYAELERWRAAGVRTVGAPPQSEAGK